MKLEWEKVPVRGSNRVLQEHEKAELPDRNYIQVYLLAFPHQPYRVQANLTRPDNINLTVNVLSGQGGTTIEGIKAAAEEWAAEQFPLQALAQVAKLDI